MAGTRLHNVCWLAALSFAFVGALAAGAEAQSQGTLRFNVKDYVGLTQVRLADTMKTATAIYAAAGVEVGWTYRCFRRCGEQVEVARASSVDETMDLTINILPDAMMSTTFPKSVMGSAPIGSAVVYAFFDRVVEFARKRNLMAGTLLGHVIAHEVGHLLLREGHAERGLMRAEWRKPDLVLAQTGRLGFTPEQGVRIRALHVSSRRREIAPLRALIPERVTR